MTRDEARQHWASSGLTYDALTDDNVEALRRAVNKALRASGLIKNYRAESKVKRNRRPPENWVEIRCASYYFRDRQAVTFESNGFVGFAGWADDTNVQPILSAFVAWVDDLRREVRP
jgi:hypothetical protein